MPRPEPTRTRTTALPAAPATDTRSALRFGLLNGAMFVLALAAIAGGFSLLAQGSTTGAPLLLTLGFAVLLPLAIIL